jgi:hypothetical protein
VLFYLPILHKCQDFYDYKVTLAEGFSKKRLFEILDGLEAQTRPLCEAALKQLEGDKGAASLEPWNRGYVLAGETEKKQDK